MQKRVENIIKSVSKEHSIPEYVAKAIVESQFQCAREAMSKGESGVPSTFLNVRLRHIGILVARKRRINKLHAAKVAKNKN